MLHKQTVEPQLLIVLEKLVKLPALNNFVLVGGTALSLQIGNRKSIDIDLFTNSAWDIDAVEETLIEECDFVTQNKFKGGLLGRINQIKVDIISHKYAWVKPFATIEGIPLASLADIAAMKLNAICSNGTRLKDYIDIAFLGNRFSLNEMTDFYHQKYPSVNSIIAVKSLCYFDDIDFDVTIEYIEKPLKWEQISSRLIEMVQQPNKVFRQPF
ncbi:MAG: nucleotidyl transferase AbiEii/AbiGii toxin family protein [Bacteroidia bacterium]|nr:nucleotidyl transferase AbiEii/AbiGii toxin family protein [Bacteroidia bacterium]MCC7532414.1 nucleotidyl transferase AbiEii/AbiGii toxin family protein [Bacteroidia bacterium]